MDVGKADEGLTPTGLNGTGSVQNQFDLSALLGHSAYNSALSSLPGGPFSLFGTHPSMFTASGTPSMPFAGLGSFGDSLLTAAAAAGLSPGSLDSAARDANSEWLRLASDQVRHLAESSVAASMYPGLAANLSNPLFASMFGVPSSTIPPTSTSSGSNLLATQLSSRASKSPGSVSSRTSVDKLATSSSRLSSASSPSPLNRDQTSVRHGKRENHTGNSETTSRTGIGGTCNSSTIEKQNWNASPVDAKGTQSALSSMLESSMHSAESALYGASPMFFPFFNGNIPFPASSPSLPDRASVSSTPSKESISSPNATLQKSDRPPKTNRPSSSSLRLGNDSNRSADDAGFSSSSPSRGGEYGKISTELGLKGLHSADRRLVGSENRSSSSSSVIIKSSAIPAKSEVSPLRERVSKERAGQSHGREAHRLSGKPILSPDVQSPHGMNASLSGSSLKRRASPRPPSAKNLKQVPVLPDSDSRHLAFSQDGAIDLSVKRPRHSASPPSSAVEKKPSTLLSSTKDQNAAMMSQALAAQLQPMMAGLSGASNVSDFSLSLAAAGLFPPLFDPSMFYQPSMLGAMAALSQGSAAVANSKADSEKLQVRGRGRRRGSGRGSRTSSMFISSLFAQQQQSAVALGGAEDPRSGRGRGGRGSRSRGGRGNRGNGMGRPRTESAPTMLADLEAQRRQYLNQLIQQGQSADQQQSATSKSANEAIRDSLRSLAALDAKSRHEGNGGGSAMRTSEKMHQRNSKLSQSMASDRRRNDSLGGPELDGSFKMSSDACRPAAGTGQGSGGEHRSSGAEFGSSLRTDSDAANEETSSACSSETASEVDGHSARGSEVDFSAAWHEMKKVSVSDGGQQVKKRRRTILDESVVQVPLQRGWQRETRVRSFTPRKIIGEVLYITPCDRRLRNYNEVDKFLEKGGITDLTRENFTFSTKVNSGRFFEQQISGEANTWVLLSDEEVANRFVIIEERKRRIIESKLRAQQREEKRMQSEELVARLAEARMQKRMEQQELAKKVAEMKMRKKVEKEQQKEMLQRARQLRVMEVRRMRERQKMARQQERFHRQMQLKMEREVRSRQINEEKEVRRQQDVANREQEREKRRLELLMARATEARKKEEEKQEKERLREEARIAKKIEKENQMAQKRWEMFLLREQRKATDDMCIVDSKPLPEFERIPGLRLPDKAFADSLMVLEFINNYASTLGLDADSLPSLCLLQGGLLNEEGYSREFTLLTIRLLKCAVEDPGFNNPRESVLLSGQKFSDIEMSENGLSELLRIFIKSRNGGRDNELSSALLTTPFLSMNATHKAAILAFLCTELLSSKNINADIEKNIELVTNLRRDKWVIESKLRKLQILHAQHQRKMNVSANVTTTTPGIQHPETVAIENGAVAKQPTEADDLKPIESGDESDHADDLMSQLPNSSMLTAHDSDTETQNQDEDKKATLEELQAKIDKLVKQQNQLRERCFNISHKLSAMMFGQDRYHRRYWVFPKCGGIFVEGLESGDPELSDPDAPLLDAVPETLAFICAPLGEPIKLEKVSADSNAANQKVFNRCNPELAAGLYSDVLQTNCVAKMEVVDTCDAVNGRLPSQRIDCKPSSIMENSKANSEMKAANHTSTLANVVNGYLPKTKEERLTANLLPVSCKNEGVAASNIVNQQSSSTFLEKTCVDDIHELKKDALCVPRNGLQLKAEESVSNLLPAASTSCSVTSTGFPSPSVGFHHKELSSASFSQLSTPSSDSVTAQLVTPSTIDVRISFHSRPLAQGLSASKAAVIESFRIAMLSAANSMQLPLEYQHIPAPIIPPVPLAKQRGWWRITNPELLKDLMNCLNPRGIREKSLYKSLERHMNFANLSCTRAKKNAMKLEVNEESKRIQSSPTSAPNPDDCSKWDFESHRRIELKVLEDIETAEERMCSASLQAKGYKVPPRASTDKSVELVSHAVRNSSLSDNQQLITVVARSRLLGLERSVERRYLKPPLGRSNHLALASGGPSGGSALANTSSVSLPILAKDQSDEDSDEEDETATRELSSWRAAVNNATSAAQLHLYLAQLQRCIAWEKSIMKVLCQICCRDDNEAQLLLCDMCDRGYHSYCIKPKLEKIPEGDWYCYECLSKASGEVCCLVCGRQLGRMLTCDSCCRHVHLDCLDPPVSRVPKKWSCSCCSTEKGKLKSRSSTCLSTPVKDFGSETNGSVKELDESESNEPASCSQDSKSDADTPGVPSSPTSVSESCGKAAKPPKQRDRSEKKRDRSKKDKRVESKSVGAESPACNGSDVNTLEVCRVILGEMREHVDAWPFQTPVSSKQFPTYRKVIRCPIDFQTMARKLKSGIYKCREEFSSDARLVFANCELFNEDNSLVGIAGHSMKSFFETRWAELTSSSAVAMEDDASAQMLSKLSF